MFAPLRPATGQGGGLPTDVVDFDRDDRGVGGRTCLFKQYVPTRIIVTTLVLTGYARASQFTSANALSYADVPLERVSAASTLLAVL